MPLPIESFDGQDFARLLSLNNHTTAEVRNLLEEPPLEPAVQPKTGTLRSLVADQREVRLHRIGQREDSEDT
jgi:hypothetical protein